jgi:hypothetical protein
MSDTELNDALPLCCESRFIYCYAECRYAECRNVVCRYAEFHGAKNRLFNYTHLKNC